jgi:hypothetical protein
VGRFLLIKPESFVGAVGQRLNRLNLNVDFLPLYALIIKLGKIDDII